MSKSAPLGGAAEELESNGTLCSFSALDTLSLGLVIAMLWHKPGCRSLLLLGPGGRHGSREYVRFHQKQRDDREHGMHRIQLLGLLILHTTTHRSAWDSLPGPGLQPRPSPHIRRHIQKCPGQDTLVSWLRSLLPFLTTGAEIQGPSES